MPAVLEKIEQETKPYFAYICYSFACMIVFSAIAIPCTIFGAIPRANLMNGYKKTLGTVISSDIVYDGKRYDVWYFCTGGKGEWSGVIDYVKKSGNQNTTKHNFKFRQDDDGIYLPAKQQSRRLASSSSHRPIIILNIYYNYAGEINKTIVQFNKTFGGNQTRTYQYEKIRFNYTGGHACRMKAGDIHVDSSYDACDLAFHHGFIGKTKTVYYKPPDYRNCVLEDDASGEAIVNTLIVGFVFWGLLFFCCLLSFVLVWCAIISRKSAQVVPTWKPSPVEEACAES